jgi:hypothetical protein
MIYLLLVPMLCSGLYAHAGKSKTFKINGSFYEFSIKDDLLVNETCAKKCIAISKVHELKKKKTLPPQVEGMTTLSNASRACMSMHGSSLLGVDIQKNMKSFCYFKEDESMVEFSSLEAVTRNFKD